MRRSLKEVARINVYVTCNWVRFFLFYIGAMYELRTPTVLHNFYLQFKTIGDRHINTRTILVFKKPL